MMIRNKFFSLLALLIVSFLLSSCGGYSPQHYFKSYLNDPIPKSVTHLRGKYSGFPQGFVYLSFFISQEDFLSLEALKKIPEVDRKTMDGLLFRRFDNLNEYQKYYMLLQGSESGKKHIQCIFWNPQGKKVYFYSE